MLEAQDKVVGKPHQQGSTLQARSIAHSCGGKLQPAETPSLFPSSCWDARQNSSESSQRQMLTDMAKVTIFRPAFLNEPRPGLPNLEPIATLVRLGSGSCCAIGACACALYPTGAAP